MPNHDSAVVPHAKVKDYLLPPIHPTGRHKAALFQSFGFSATSWTVLSSALLRHAAQNEIADVQDTPFGRRYILDGRMPAPDGRAPLVRTVWFVETSDGVPRFVTAYPIRTGNT